MLWIEKVGNADNNFKKKSSDDATSFAMPVEYKFPQAIRRILSWWFQPIWKETGELWACLFSS